MSLDDDFDFDMNMDDLNIDNEDLNMDDLDLDLDMTGLGDDSLAFDTQEFTQPDVTQELDVNQNKKSKPVKPASSSSNVVPEKQRTPLKPKKSSISTLTPPNRNELPVSRPKKQKRNIRFKSPIDDRYETESSQETNESPLVIKASSSKPTLRVKEKINNSEKSSQETNQKEVLIKAKELCKSFKKTDAITKIGSKKMICDYIQERVKQGPVFVPVQPVKTIYELQTQPTSDVTELQRLVETNEMAMKVYQELLGNAEVQMNMLKHSMMDIQQATQLTKEFNATKERARRAALNTAETDNLKKSLDGLITQAKEKLIESHNKNKELVNEIESRENLLQKYANNEE